ARSYRGPLQAETFAMLKTSVSDIIPTYDSRADLHKHVADAFEKQFGVPPETVASAPGRVNLLGEHTDYNGGFVLPMTLAMEVAVALGGGTESGAIETFSDIQEQGHRRLIGEAASGHWTDYVLGSLQLAYKGPAEQSGCRVAVGSTLPIGRGISSSAALEVAMIRAATALTGAPMEPAEIAKLARRVENDFVGMPCGIMDQFAAAAGSRGKAVFLDTRTLEFETVPLFDGFDFVVVSSGVKHRLTEGSYAERVGECNRACAALGVEELRDCSMADLDRIGALEEPLDRRARHVVTENQRVLNAARAMKDGDWARFGELMVQSHASQRDDYRVSVPEIDDLVAGAMQEGATGARLTGGGFGGSIVALVRSDITETWCRKMVEQFPASEILAVS
ncbi:MAG: galactokinase, partial [Firmicutes bacterium]|nr:galactokinase [Bacillota bacterium]